MVPSESFPMGLEADVQDILRCKKKEHAHNAQIPLECPSTDRPSDEAAMGLLEKFLFGIFEKAWNAIAAITE